MLGNLPGLPPFQFRPSPFIPLHFPIAPLAMSANIIPLAVSVTAVHFAMSLTVVPLAMSLTVVPLAMSLTVVPLTPCPSPLFLSHSVNHHYSSHIVPVTIIPLTPCPSPFFLSHSVSTIIPLTHTLGVSGLSKEDVIKQGRLLAF